VRLSPARSVEAATASAAPQPRLRVQSGAPASRIAELVSILLLGAAFAVIQALIAGMRLLFSLPAYGLLAVMGVLALVSLRRAKPEPNQLCLVSSAIFFGYVVARALYSPVPYLARADIYSVLGGLLVYFFTATIFTAAKRRMFFLVFLIAAAMAHVVIGLIQFTEGNNFMLIPFLQRFDYGRRASGFYVCPNHLAGLLEVLGVFGLSIACWSRWPMWAKLLTAYGAGICYLGLILTGSRGGYLSALASLFVFGVLSLIILLKASAKIFWRVGGPLVLAAIVICTAVIFSVHQSYYLSARADNLLGDNLADPSSALRESLWQAALRQWTLQPFVGTGSGTYLYYGRQFRVDQVQGDPVHVHNDYLQLLAEYGLLGAAGFLVFLGLHLRRGWKTFERLGPKRVAASVAPSFLSDGLALNIGALAAISAYIVHSIFDFNLHIPANVLLLAFVFGALANAGIQRDAALPPPTFSLLLWRLTLPVIGAIVAIQCARLLPGEYFAERSRTALRDNHAREAVLFALDGLAYERSNPNLYSYFGRALALQGALTPDPRKRVLFYEAAIRELQNARELAPQDMTFATELGFVYDALGRFTEGEWMYQEAIALDPKSNLLKQDYQTHLEKWRTGEISFRSSP
jgi:O-antigen ligase